MENTRIGFAMCGSFCTFAAALEQAKLLAEEGFDILPIMSENAYSTDTRFGTAQSCIDTLQELSGKDIVHTIVQAEPIGPKNLADVLVVAPCTSNTLAKIANGVNDTAVTMAVKSQLRNGKPVVLALSTNDALAAAADLQGSVRPTLSQQGHIGAGNHAAFGIDDTEYAVSNFF